MQDLPNWRDLVQKVLAAPNGIEAFGLIVQYIEEMNRQMNVDEVKALVAKVAGDKTEAVLMTLTEQARQQGREEGRKEGRDEGRTEGRTEGRIAEARAALRRVLERRRLKITRAVAKRIETCTDLAALERWLVQAVDARTLAEALR